MARQDTTGRHALTSFDFDYRNVEDGRSHWPNDQGFHMTHLFRKGDGEPIRAAMREAGLSGPQLAEATREVDPDGRGLSAAAIGKITGQGKTAQDRCRLGSAWLLVEALETKGVVAPLQHLFSRTPMLTDSTSTIERSKTDAQ